MISDSCLRECFRMSHNTLTDILKSGFATYTEFMNVFMADLDKNSIPITINSIESYFIASCICVGFVSMPLLAMLREKKAKCKTCEEMLYVCYTAYVKILLDIGVSKPDGIADLYESIRAFCDNL